MMMLALGSGGAELLGFYLYAGICLGVNWSASAIKASSCWPASGIDSCVN